VRPRVAFILAVIVLIAVASWFFPRAQTLPGAVEPQSADLTASPAVDMAGSSREGSTAARPSVVSSPSMGNISTAPVEPRARARSRMTPEQVAGWRAQSEIELQRIYEDVGRDLALSAEESAALIELLVDQRVRYAEFAPAHSVEDAPARKEFDAQLKREIEAQIGADRARKLGEYQRSLRVRYEVENLRKKLGNEALALTEVQRRQLIERGIERGAYAGPTIFTGAESELAVTQEQVARNDLAIQRLMEVARGVLAPEQFQKVEELLEIERASVDHYLRHLEQEQRNL